MIGRRALERLLVVGWPACSEYVSSTNNTIAWLAHCRMVGVVAAKKSIYHISAPDHLPFLPTSSSFLRDRMPVFTTRNTPSYHEA